MELVLSKCHGRVLLEEAEHVVVESEVSQPVELAAHGGMVRCRSNECLDESRSIAWKMVLDLVMMVTHRRGTMICWRGWWWETRRTQSPRT